MTKLLLIILDGFGEGKDSAHNAIANAEMPFFTPFKKSHPHALLTTHGEAVGLPAGIMGNSEVGHMTLGSGQVLLQSLLRIDRAIADGSFEKNPVLVKTMKTAREATGRLHIMGLLSDGGVHSHISHAEALMDLACNEGVDEVIFHAFLDGRDTPPQSSVEYVKRLQTHRAFREGKARFGSVSGRFYAMDRDKRWERTEKAYLALHGQSVAGADSNSDILDIIESQHSAGTTDEFIVPTPLGKDSGIRDDDAVVFLNFRADRARQISRAISSGEKMPKRLSKPATFVAMTEYDSDLKVPVAYDPKEASHILGELLADQHAKQFRIAETEKYAHITFFFNGGREEPFAGEDRLLVQSPKDVSTYDLKPEMSAPTVTAEAIKRLQGGKYDFVLMNFANPDMVGHTGNYEATVAALKSLDACLAKLIPTAIQSGYEVIVTADHGNAEEMVDIHGRAHTQHTLNPVPIVWASPNDQKGKRLEDGGLPDVMPTVCQLMQIKVPDEVDGRSLVC